MPAENFNGGWPPGDFVDDAPFPIRRFAASNGQAYEAMRTHIAQSFERPGIGLYGFSDQSTDTQLDFLVRVRHELGARVLVKIPTLREFHLYISNADRKARVLHADYFICPNPAIQHGLMEASIPREKTIFRPNGVPVDRLRLHPQRKKPGYATYLDSRRKNWSWCSRGDSLSASG